METRSQKTSRIRNLYIGATGWRWEDHEGSTDLSGLRESLADEFDEWLSEYVKAYVDRIDYLENKIREARKALG